MGRHLNSRASLLSIGILVALIAAACGPSDDVGAEPQDEQTEQTGESPDSENAEPTGGEEAAGAGCTNDEVLREVAEMSAEDRETRLAELAAEETDTLTLASTTNPRDLELLIERFQQDYGFSVEQLSGLSGSEMLERFSREHQAGRMTVDAMGGSTEMMQFLQNAGALAPVESPHADTIRPDAVHGRWYGVQFNVLLVQRNADLVPADRAPTTYEELADYEGSIGVVFDNWDQMMAVVKYWVDQGKYTEEEAIEVWRSILSRPNVSAHTSNTPLGEGIQTGEMGLALTFHHFHPRYHGQGDSPMEWEPSVEPVVGRQNGIGVPCLSPNPAMGMLWLDFQLKPEIQQLFGETLGRDVTNVDVNTGVTASPEGYEIVFPDPQAILDEGERWRSLMEEMLSQR